MLGLGSSLLQGGALRSIVRSGLQLFYKADRTQAPLGEEQIRNNSFDEISGNLVSNPTFDLGSEAIQNGTFNLGSEEVVDGNFPLPNLNWLALAGATIESNGARINNTITGGVAAVKQIISNPSGKTFEFTYDVVATDGSTLVVQQLSNIDLDTTTVGTNRKITFTWDLGLDDLIIKRKSGTTDVTIDNVSLKEVANWDLLNGATISNNKANIIGDGSSFTSIKQTGVFENGKVYQVVVDVTITSGLGLKFQDGANDENIGFATTTGIYTFNFTGTSNADLVVGRRTSDTAFNSSVNSISVKEVPNWELGDGWSIVDGKASNDGESGSNNLTQASILASNKSYQITIEVSDFVSGNVEVSAGGSPRGRMTANGTYTFNQVASGSNFYIVANSFVGSVDNVSVKQLDPNNRWTVGTGWVLNGNGTITHTGSAGNFESSQELVTGKKYEATVVVDSIADASCNLFNSSNSETYDNEITTAGTHVKQFTATHATSKIALRSESSNLVVSSFSVKEITNSIKDHSRNSNDGILYSGKALALDPDTGALDYVSLKPSNEIGITSAGFTFAIWFKADSTQSNGEDDRIFTSLRTSSASYFSIGLTTSGHLRFHLRESDASLPSTVVQNNYRDDKWHRVVVSASPTVQYVYVDNELVSTTTIVLGGTPSADLARLGTAPQPNSTYSLKCNLADLQTYDKAWNATDVKYDWENPDKDVFDRVGEAQVLGEELNDLSWLVNGDWSTDGDIASNDGGGSTLTNDILELGKTYQFKCKLSSYTSGEFSLYLGISNESSRFSGTNEFTFIGVCTGGTIARVKAHSGNGSLSISSLTIKEVTTHASHILPTDCKSLLRLNEGAGDRVYDAAPVLGAEEVQNGDFSELGSEEITDGDFPTGTTAWVEGDGWNITNGVAVCDGTQTSSTSLISNAMSLTVDKTYKVTVNVSSTSSGFRLYDDIGVVDYNLDVGENIFYRTLSTSSYSITSVALAGSTGSISNISVKEVPNWTLQNGWSLSSNGAVFNSSLSQYRKLYQVNFLTIGKTYQLTFEIKSITSGSIANKEPNSPSFNTIGVKTQTYVATYDDLYLEPTNDAVLTINNVSVKEIKPAESFAIVGDKNFIHQQPYIPQYAMSSFSKKMLFDGSNDYVTGSFNGNIGPAKDMTFSCWFSYEDSVEAVNDRETLFSLLSNPNDTYPYRKLEVSIIENNRIFAFTGDGSDYSTTSTTADSLVKNKLNHVAVSISSTGEVKIYINGALEVTGSSTYFGAATVTHYRIGSRDNTTMLNKGIIDEVSLFKSELTQAEVLELYNSGSSFDSTGHSKYNLGEEVSNGTFELGSEEVVNGDFATDSDWTKRNGSTINNVANVIANGSIGSTTYNWSLESLANVFETSKTYRIKFRAKQVSLAGSNAGTFQVGNSYGALFDEVITSEFVDYTFTTQVGSNNWPKLTAGGRTAGDVFQIDNVSVKEIPNWSSSTASSATISVNTSGQLELASDAGDELGAYTPISLVQGRTYVLSVDIIYCDVSGQIRIGTSASVGSTSPKEIFDAAGSGVPLGTNTYTFTATSAQASNGFLYIGGRDDVDSLVIDNVSLQEYGLSAYWRNNGADQWDDLSINSNHGTVSGSPTEIFLQEVPFFGKDSLGMFMNKPRLGGLNFNGSGYVEIHDTNDLDFPAATGVDNIGEFSVECWVRYKFLSQGSTVNCIYSNGEEVNDVNTFSLITNQDNKIGFYVNGTLCSSASTFSLDEWVHVVGIREHGTNGVKLYINGNTTPEATATNNNTVTNSFNKRIGWDGHANRYLEGVVDDVKLYNRALTPAEIKKNYNATKGKHKN